MTYKNMLLGKMKYLILFLIAIQSVLLALMAIFLQVFSMRSHGKVITVILEQLQFIFKDYLKNSRKVYTNTFWNKVTCLFGRNVLQIVVGMAR